MKAILFLLIFGAIFSGIEAQNTFEKYEPAVIAIKNLDKSWSYKTPLIEKLEKERDLRITKLLGICLLCIFFGLFILFAILQSLPIEGVPDWFRKSIGSGLPFN